MSDLYALIVVSMVFVLSNMFWAWHVHVLVNKLMSRNFFEYREATLKTDKKNKTITPGLHDDPDVGTMSELLN